MTRQAHARISNDGHGRPIMLSRRAAARTSVGLVRPLNEDHFYVGPAARVVAVIDGMGGAAGGEVAAHLTVETVDRVWRESPPPRAGDGDGDGGEAVGGWLIDAIARANAAIRAAGERETAVRGMGA